MSASSPFLLDTFSPLDLHFAMLMHRLDGSECPPLLLAAALASNAVQEGHVCADLRDIAGTPMNFDNPPAAADRWPELHSWIEIISKTKVMGEPGQYRPLVLSGSRLYLYRYWDYEQRLLAVLRKRTTSPILPCDTNLAAAALASLFPARQNGTDWQKIAAAVALLRNFCVISGGPGTGKTSTVVRIAALLAMLSGKAAIRIALAAPTGKAAARLEESVEHHLSSIRCAPEITAKIPRTASTIHALLRPLPDSPFFRHNKDNPLPYDAVIVDEASMVDLALMTKLLEAIPANSRVILLGDKDQLASVEAGALLGDLCDTGSEHGYSVDLCESIRRLMPEFSERGSLREPPIADSLVTLKTNFRFGVNSGIGRVSLAVNKGDDEETVSLLKSTGFADCTWWIPHSYKAILDRLQEVVMSTLPEYLNADDPETALNLFGKFRILCAVRNGPLGVATMNGTVEAILAANHRIARNSPYYRGKPVIITRNDYAIGLYNGDTGIVMPDAGDGNTPKAFFSGNQIRAVPLFKLPPHETAYALTIHKAQGSEFERTIIILPSQPSPIVTRELLYTATTRSRKRCEIWCSEEMLRHGVTSKTRRTSGLREALWDH